MSVLTHQEVCDQYSAKAHEAVDSILAALIQAKVEPWLAYAALLSVTKVLLDNYPDCKKDMKKMSHYFETGTHDLTSKPH